MQILTMPPPALDPNDTRASFRAISDYLQKVMETIDFTLGKYGGELSGTVDTKTIEQLINSLNGTINGLQASIANLRDTAQNGFAETSKAISALTEKMTDLKDDVSALDSRISALEQKQEGTP